MKKKTTAKKSAKVVKKVSRPAAKKKNTPAARRAVVVASPVSSHNQIGITPLADRVVVRPLSPEEMGTTTSFGIIIPDTARKEKPEQGTVVAVGIGKLLDDGSVRPVEVEVGDRVMFSKYGFDEIKIGGVEYFIVSEANILAVLG